MTDPRELYQQVILEHNRKPRNFGRLEPCTHHAHGLNPLCGDDIEVTLNVEGGRVGDIRFRGQGCAISQASASMMTAGVKGRPTEDAEAMAAQFRDMIRGAPEPPPEGDLLGRLRIFRGVRDLPSRVKCAVLPWATLQGALRGEGTASTE